MLLPFIGLMVGAFMLQEARHSKARGSNERKLDVSIIFAATFISLLLTIAMLLLGS
jgi:hypothetical protein